MAGKTTEEQIEFASRTLYALSAENKRRIENGMKLRNELHKALDAGKEPDGYRIEWLRKSSLILVDCLHNIALEFNMLHSDDRASAYDLMDIIATAANLMKESMDK